MSGVGGSMAVFGAFDVIVSIVMQIACLLFYGEWVRFDVHLFGRGSFPLSFILSKCQNRRGWCIFEQISDFDERGGNTKKKIFDISGTTF